VGRTQCPRRGASDNVTRDSLAEKPGFVHLDSAPLTKHPRNRWPAETDSVAVVECHALAKLLVRIRPKKATALEPVGQKLHT
jgi:hypothetical protein